MSQYQECPLSQFILSSSVSVDPKKYLDEQFDLYSIPAYDQRKPELVKGNEIGSAKKAVEPNDVMLSRIVPHIRRVWIVNAKNSRRQIASGEWIVFRSEHIVSGFLRYFLLSDIFHRQFMMTVTGVGGSLLRAQPSQVEKIKIPLPPLPIQKRIAAILEKADAAREERRQTIELTDKFLQSAFLEMFGNPVTNPKGWKVVTVEDVTTHVTSGSTPLGGQSTYLNAGVLFIRSQNVLMNAVDFSDIAFISEEVHKNMKRTWVKKGDVLLNITGASIGRVSYFKGKDDSANVNQHVCIVRPDTSKIIPEYLSFHISMPSYQSLILSRNSGATRQAFNFDQIRHFKINLPTLSLQQKFAALVEKVEAMRTKQRASEQELENLFQSLMQRAFKGELVR